ncbi:hypothetical protein [Thermococcus sp. 9N3]|uniref:hypothetical protein n=1 Tax=Thermococcus sp. 9N3 TaxID=163002 RepID=UPI00143195B3|nr:hypothetical protein [Thermococcus sp. 9N3]NJE48184.1 hypothetical protein [Thermococcus sp. 9N3]
MTSKIKVYVPRIGIDNEIIEDKALELLKENKFLLITGPEGSGKTMTSEFIGWKLSKENIVFRIIPVYDMSPGFHVKISQIFEGYLVDILVSSNTLGLEARLFEVFLSMAKLSKINFEKLEKNNKFINTIRGIFASLKEDKLDALKEALISFSSFLPGFNFIKSRVDRKALITLAESIRDIISDPTSSGLISGTLLINASGLSAISTALTLILVMTNLLELREIKEVEGDIGKSLMKKFKELLSHEIKERDRGIVVIFDDIADAKYGMGKSYDAFLDFAKIAYDAGLSVLIVHRLSIENELDKFSKGESPITILAGREDYFPQSWIYVPYPDSEEFYKIIKYNWDSILPERMNRNLKGTLTDNDLEELFLKTGGNIKLALELMKLVDIKELSGISRHDTPWKRRIKLYALIFRKIETEYKNNQDHRFPFLFGILSLDEVEKFNKILNIPYDILDVEETCDYGWGIRRYMVENGINESFVVCNLNPENIWLRRILAILEETGEESTKKRLAKYRQIILNVLTEKIKDRGIFSERMLLVAIFNIERLNVLGKLNNDDLLYWMTILLNTLYLEPQYNLYRKAINVALSRKDLLSLSFMDALVGYLRRKYPDEKLLDVILSYLEQYYSKNLKSPVEKAFYIRLKAEILFIIYSNRTVLKKKKFLKLGHTLRLQREYEKLEKLAKNLPAPYNRFILQRVLFWKAEILRNEGEKEKALETITKAENLLEESLENIEWIPKEFISVYTKNTKESYKMTILTELESTLSKKAFILTELGKLNEAEKIAERTIEISEHERLSYSTLLSAKERLLWIKVLKNGPSREIVEEISELLKTTKELLSISSELKARLCVEYILLSLISSRPLEWDTMTTICILLQLFWNMGTSECPITIHECSKNLRDPIRALVAGTFLLVLIKENKLKLLKNEFIDINVLIKILFMILKSSTEILVSLNSILGLYSLAIVRLVDWILKNIPKRENAQGVILEILTEFIENGKEVAKTDFERQLLKDIEENMKDNPEGFMMSLIKLVYYLIPKAVATTIKLPTIRYAIQFGS